MKVDFYTYNTSPQTAKIPNFMARPIRVNWNSDSGKAMLEVMAWMASVGAAGIVYAKNHKESLDEDELQELQNYKEEDCTEEALLENSILVFDELYSKSKDPKIMDKHLQLLKDAFAQRNLLRGGYSDLTDYELARTVLDVPTIDALSLVGQGNLKYTFSLDYVGFKNFCKNISNFIKTVSNKNLERLKKKINPEVSNEYRNLEEDVKKDKKQIGKLLGKDNITKREKLLSKIEALKGDKSNSVKIKELRSEIQNLYRTGENASAISQLMQAINDKQRKMRELINQKVKLSPQEIINKVWTIASIIKSPHYRTNHVFLPDDIKGVIEQSGTYQHQQDGTFLMQGSDLEDLLGNDVQMYYEKNSRKLNKDVKEMIELINSSSPENNKAWIDNINKKIYERAGLTYNKQCADWLDLANCKYINELIVSDEDFWNTMSALLEVLTEYHYTFPNMSMADILDDFVCNDETKKLFKENEINYKKWVGEDKNSYVKGSVTIRAEDAKKKAVKNMMDDLLLLYQTSAIPQKEKDIMFKALKAIGVKIWQQEWFKYPIINDRVIEFSDLDSIMSAIKNELNTNTFWSVESNNQVTDKMRDTLYCHFMLQRKQEIDCAKRLKDKEKVDIKVQKVNMADIKHSIGLGNDSHCCTALGSQSNEWSAPSYIVTRAIGAIEVLANDEAVGNTMMYFAKVNGELSLVLDDIELQTKYQNNDKIKDMIIKYAQKVCKEVGQPNVHIYAGPGMQKVDISKYELIDSEMEIIGRLSDGWFVYLDFDNDAHELNGAIEKTKLYRIK